MASIIIVEDDFETSELYKRCIMRAWPNSQLRLCRDRESAEMELDTDRPDLVLLDIELDNDKYAGIGIINKINRDAPCPVLVVSGVTMHRPVMLELEAWDFLQKPVDEASLIAVIRNILRHTTRLGVIKEGERVRESTKKSENNGEPLPAVPPVIFSEWRGKKLNLSVTSLRILNHLYDNKNSVVLKGDLHQYLPAGRSDMNLRGHIQTIRQAFQDADRNFDKIITVPVKGYIWRE